MFFTSFLLDVTGGLIWWLTKNSFYIIYNGVSYILTYNCNDNNTENMQKSITLSESEYICLKNEIKELKKICLDKNNKDSNY